MSRIPPTPSDLHALAERLRAPDAARPAWQILTSELAWLGLWFVLGLTLCLVLVV